MLDPLQAKAYAEADFAAPHQMIADQFAECFPGLQLTGQVLDLGCGPADLLIRFARNWPEATFHGIDGSAAMLAEASRLVKREQLQGRIHLFERQLTRLQQTDASYQAIISNSLLHHLHQPALLWQTIKELVSTGPDSRVAVYITDLTRPASVRQAKLMVEKYSGAEPQLLRKDFYNSLLAAFTPAEIEQQLHDAGINSLNVTTTSDRHLRISGYLNNQP